MNIINDFPANAEYFRVIDGFPKYDVSTDGRVRYINTGRIMKCTGMKDSYVRVQLTKDGIHSRHYVHRLVAFAFCNKEDNCTVVDHIDRNRANNNYRNLRWTTASGNNRNRTKQNNNTSGVSGVQYYNKGCWVASWNDENMKLQRKSFSVKIHGDEQAKQMAINLRKQMAEDNAYINIELN
jgi:hypothetical protein